MKLSSRSHVPPGLFRFRHPISGHEESFHSWSRLRSWVDSHCEGNGYPPITDAEIEAQICERLGPDAAGRYCEGDGQSVDGVSLGWRDILQGTRVMASFILAGRPLVDSEEAERRAAICNRCKFNVKFSKPCGGICEDLKAAVEAIVGANETSLDDRLESCAVCKCHLRSKIWIPIDILRKSDAPEYQAKYPDFCWQKSVNAV